MTPPFYWEVTPQQLPGDLWLMILMDDVLHGIHDDKGISLPSSVWCSTPPPGSNILQSQANTDIMIRYQIALDSYTVLQIK